MKKILYLSFYYEPDLCAGSFRNTSLAKELAKASANIAEIHLFTTQPNRYNTFQIQAPEIEFFAKMRITRITIPKHKSGMMDQIFSFRKYYNEVMKRTKEEKYDLVFASSSRLFTAYLGYKVAKKKQALFYVDVRDIFYDTMNDVLKSSLLKKILLPFLKWIERKTFNYSTHINLISEGFCSYFIAYKKEFSYFTNGIDPIFLNMKENGKSNHDTNTSKTIVYAGNIGEGQGLHTIIPKAAAELPDHQFIIIGDGGAKLKLENEIKSRMIKNIELRTPVKQAELIHIYSKADFLFLHLNDYKAFEKVLPSKVFELAAFDKPIIAGVGGYAKDFIKKYVPNTILFSPSNHCEMIKNIRNYQYQNVIREKFINTFKRENINKEIVNSILKYL